MNLAVYDLTGEAVVYTFTAAATWLVAIEAIQPGDTVVAWDETTGEQVVRPVDEVYRRVSGHLRHLTITFHDGTTDRHETTDEHPYWVVGRGWTAAADLTVGDVLKTADDTTATLTASFREETPDGTAVYNFRVPGEHDYYVASPNAGTGASSCVLVHNANCGVSQVPITTPTKQSWPRISAVAPDWEGKGAHIHVGNVELAVWPGMDGTIVFKTVFSSTAGSAFSQAEKVASAAPKDIGFRQRLHNAAVRALQFIPKDSGKAAELRFVIAALQKMGV